VGLQKDQHGGLEQGAVGKDREQDVRKGRGGGQDLRPQKGLASGQQNEADTQLPGFAEKASPVRRGQFLHGGVIGAQMVGPGVAAGAVKVAAMGDAGDEEGRDVEAVTFVTGPRLFRLAAGFGEGRQEEAFRRIFEARSGDVFDGVLYALFQVVLQGLIFHGRFLSNGLSSNKMASDH